MSKDRIGPRLPILEKRVGDKVFMVAYEPGFKEAAESQLQRDIEHTKFKELPIEQQVRQITQYDEWQKSTSPFVITREPAKHRLEKMTKSYSGLFTSRHEDYLVKIFTCPVTGKEFTEAELSHKRYNVEQSYLRGVEAREALLSNNGVEGQ